MRSMSFLRSVPFPQPTAAESAVPTAPFTVGRIVPASGGCH
ncbi:hypothetical protein OG562_28010 [Streptomyces sp. NBC_01275]|nr:hypothetical protein [Streptomyces sp. NBC_01275]MCX4764746.1 hypothetical protein [Streptomyces sp. NBC_01275]